MTAAAVRLGLVRPTQWREACDCPPGWKHRPTCPLVTGKAKP